MNWVKDLKLIGNYINLIGCWWLGYERYIIMYCCFKRLDWEKFVWFKNKYRVCKVLMVN